MEKPVYDAVLFDLDGTLTRSEEGITGCARYALEKMGLSIPPDEDLRRFIGPPLYATFREYYGFSDAQSQQAVSYYRERYAVQGLYENAVYPGIRSILNRLRKAGVWLGVSTGKPQGPTERILEHFGLSKFFDAVAGTKENDTDADKEQLIRQALPKKFERAVMVGDRRFDVEGAKAVGLHSIGVVYGYGSRDELQAAGADYVVDTVNELGDLLCVDLPEARGFFLSVEGLDGSGKTTQVDILEKNLLRWGFDVKRTREPGGCPISEKIRQLVLDIDNLGMSATCEALLYAAARAQHVYEIIRPSVRHGKLVLCDRFVDSSIVYQGAGRQLGVELVSQINAPAVDGFLPDCTVYLDVDHLTALKRRGDASQLDRIEIEESAFHERVSVAYKRLMKENNGRFVSVDASLSPEEISAAAFEAVLGRLYAMEDME